MVALLQQQQTRLSLCPRLDNMTDLRQTPLYAKYMQSLGWSVQVTPLHKSVTSKGNGNYFYLKRIPLLGNVAKLQRPDGKINLNEIKHLIDKYRISAFYIEPSAPIGKESAKAGFKNAKSSFLPAKTIHIDLTQPERQLLKEMKPKTRYNIRLSQRKGVVVKESDDVNAFINLWKSSARSRLALPQSKEISALWNAFGKNAHLFLAYHNSQLLSGLLIACSPDTGFYMYAASNKDGKKFFAPTLLAWESIKLAKKNRCKTFDFEGIYDSRYSSTKSWRGFTKFKEGFGGKIVEFPKTLVYHNNPFLKLLNI